MDNGLIIENIEIPKTQQIDNTPPPARPSIPVPSEMRISQMT